MTHRRAGDVAMGDLLNEQTQGVARRQRGVAKPMLLLPRQLIDPLGQEKIIRAITHETKSLIERSHPWPPVEEPVSLNNTILSEGRGWRERS
jgi:hypothetical protein